MRVTKDGSEVFDIDDSDDSVKAAAAKGYVPVVEMSKDGTTWHDVMGTEDSITAAIGKGYKVKEAPKAATSKLESFGRGVLDTVSLGFDDELGAAVVAPFKDETYSELRDKIRSDKNNARESNPKTYLAGNVVGGVASAVAVPGGSSIRGAAALGAAQGLGESDADLTEGEFGEAAIDSATGAAIGGAMAYGVPKVISGVKGAAKTATRLIPGTEDAFQKVNKVTAKLGSMVPGTDIDAGELESLLNNPAQRRASRELNKPENLKKIGNHAADLLSSIDDLTEAQVGHRYAKAEHEFFSSITPDDIDNIDLSKIDKIKNIVQERPQLFGRAGKVVGQLDDILQRGGEREIGEATQDMSLQFMKKNLGEEDAAKMFAQRMLDARRHLDDVMKNVDYEKMLAGERKLIQSARDAINENLDNIPGAQDLRKMDSFYSDFVATKKDALHKLEVPLPSGGREFTPESALKFLKSDVDQARFIEAKMADFSGLMSELDGVRGADATKQINNMFSKVRDDFKVLRSLESLKRASGGPTSQAINTAMQIYGAIQTMGSSLLMMPITNPSAWMKLVDGANPIAKGILKNIQRASLEATKLHPEKVARIVVIGRMNKEDE
jgi:hypothetical protein